MSVRNIEAYGYQAEQLPCCYRTHYQKNGADSDKTIDITNRDKIRYSVAGFMAKPVGKGTDSEQCKARVGEQAGGPAETVEKWGWKAVSCV